VVLVAPMSVALIALLALVTGFFIRHMLNV
jgi:hypothetical protein